MAWKWRITTRTEKYVYAIQRLDLHLMELFTINTGGFILPRPHLFELSPSITIETHIIWSIRKILPGNAKSNVVLCVWAGE